MVEAMTRGVNWGAGRGSASRVRPFWAKAVNSTGW